jgi:hypothetical protein
MTSVCPSPVAAAKYNPPVTKVAGPPTTIVPMSRNSVGMLTRREKALCMKPATPPAPGKRDPNRANTIKNGTLIAAVINHA